MKNPFCVAIFGGAVAGSEAASLLVEQGIRVFVFDQNALPYGKIEYGLPKWHVKLRDKNEARIDEILKHPLVTYIPNCRLGYEVSFHEIGNEWGFDSVLLAIGAWKDRPLPIEGVDQFIGKGLYYQNPFVMWFNQNHDPNYDGEVYPVKDNAVVIGGGLASIDVLKIVMIELFQQKIANLGMSMDSHTIEKMGLIESAKLLGLEYNSLNIMGCTLFYRRRIIDMPISPMSENPTAEELEKVYAVRRKLVRLAQEKFLFKVKELSNPAGYLVDTQGNFEGLIFSPNKLDGRKIITDESKKFEVKTPLVISSIGSIPENIPELDYVYEKFKIESENSGKLVDFDNVYALGNAVTGRGNIKESKAHGHLVTEEIIRSRFSQEKENSDSKLEKIINRVNEINRKTGYNGNYDSWIKKHLPARLENLIKQVH